MGITSALSTGLSGLASNQARLDVIGNNIANVNTIGFKASRLDFKTQFSETFSEGSAPNGDLGGTNPLQTGMGVVQGAVSRNFNPGSRETTGVSSNLAIEGDGFFVVKDPSLQAYTRDGSFKLNSDNELVTASGMWVQGFGIDPNFNLVPGTLQNLQIPLGDLTIAEATTNAQIGGSLNANGALPTQVSNVQSQELFVSNGSGSTTGTAPTAADILTDISNSSGTPYFTSGQTLSFEGDVGGRQTATKTLTISSSTTLGDLMAFMDGTLGINTSSGANGSLSATPGTTIAAGTSSGSSVLSIFGNAGAANNISLDSSSLSGGSSAFSWTPLTQADGESVSATMTVFDSLGTPVHVNITTALIDKIPGGGTTWQFYATSPDDQSTGTGTNTAIGTGTITFDDQGKFVSATPATVTVDRTGTGANPALTFTLDFSQLGALADSRGSALRTFPNGTEKGILKDFSIDQTGIITGTFNNGLNRTLGQVALATFRNNQGLVDKGNNLFGEGPNSGTAAITAPGVLGAGHIISGALELSNVDLSSEFVQLISASTGFSAASRIITTSNQLLQELLSAAR